MPSAWFTSRPPILPHSAANAAVDRASGPAKPAAPVGELSPSSGSAATPATSPPVDTRSFYHAAICTGTTHFVRHCFGLSLIFLTIAAVLYLSVGRLSSSMTHVIQAKANEKLAGSGLQVEFSDVHFIEGEGIRFDNVSFRLDPASIVPASLPPLSTAQNLSTPTRFVPIIAAGSPLPPVQSVTAQSVTAQSVAAQSVAATVPNRSPAVRQTAYRSYFPILNSILPDSAPQLVSFDTIWLRGKWSPIDLLAKDFRPEAIELIGAQLDLRLDQQQRVIWPELHLPKAQFAPPDSIRLVDATINLQAANGVAAYQITGLSIDFHQLPFPQNTDTDSNTNSSPNTDPPSSAGNPAAPREVLACDWRFSGQMEALGLEPLQVSGTWIDQAYWLQANWTPIHVHRGVWEKFAGFIPESLAAIYGVSGWLALDSIQLSGRWAEGQVADPPQFSVSGRLQQVMIENDKLPQPVLNLAANFVATNAGLHVENIQGAVADGNFHASLYKTDWSTPHARLHVSGTRIPFDRDWTGLLSENLRAQWERFQPEGHFDCELDFAYDPAGNLARSGSVDLHQVSYVYADFPVPISGLEGRIILEQSDCRFDLATLDQRYPMKIDGWVNQMGPDWTGRIEIRSTRFHPIDDSFLLGLHNKPKAVEIIRQMNPAGMMATSGFIERPSADTKADMKFNVEFLGGEVRHQKFPYRVFGISGSMLFDNGRIVVNRLEGVSSTGNISATGLFDTGGKWWVQIVGQAVELNHELFQSLDAGQQEVWQQLNPKGVLDEVVLDLGSAPESGFQLSLSGSQQPSTASDPSDLSINPTWFPYQLDGISGKFLYRNQQVTLSGIRGNHGPVAVVFDGMGMTTPEHWQVTIYNLLTGQIPLDRDIKSALPETVRSAADQLRLTGTVGVQGSVTIFKGKPDPHSLVNRRHRSGSANSGPPMQLIAGQSSTRFQSPDARNAANLSRTTDASEDSYAPQVYVNHSNLIHDPGANLFWDLRLDMEDAAVEVGLPAKHVHGMVRLKGESSAGSAFCEGQLKIDSAMIEGVQLTSIEGPIWMNEREILFGTQALASLNSQSDRISPVESLLVNPTSADSALADNRVTPFAMTPPNHPNGGLRTDTSLLQIPAAHLPTASVSMETMGGRIALDGRVLLRDDLPFQMQASVNHVDLKAMAQQFAPHTKDIAGQGFASLTLGGSSLGRHTLNGKGIVRIKNAKLYEVPVFLQLLKILQVRTPDKTAFDEGKIDFRILGEDIDLNRIELNGDAITLIGNGRADLNQNLDLDFYTVPGRNRFYLPLVSDLLHAGSQQLLWISIDGTMSQPVTKHETLRALNEAVQLLIDDMEAASKLLP